MTRPTLQSYVVTHVGTGGFGTSALNMTAPDGIAEDDLLMIFIGSDDTGNGDEFSIVDDDYPGWTKDGESGSNQSGAHCGMFWKIADGTEGDVVVNSESAFPFDEMGGWYCIIAGADTSTPIEQSAYEDESSSTTHNFLYASGSLPAIDDGLTLAMMALDGSDLVLSGPNSVDCTLTEVDNFQAGSNPSGGLGGLFVKSIDVVTGDEDLGNYTSTVADGNAIAVVNIMPSASTPVTVAVTGVEAAGEVGTGTTVIGDARAAVTGIEAAGEVGSATVVAVRNVTVVVTGVSAAGVVGDIAVSGKAVVIPTGLEAAAEVGEVTVIALGGIVVSVTGISATGSVGSPVVTGGANVSVTGLEASSDVGDVVISADANVGVTGVLGTGQVGSASVVIDVNATVTGVSATGEVGSASVVISVPVTVEVTGVSATGEVGTPWIIHIHTPNQVPNWAEVTPVQTPVWVETDPTDSSGWTEIGISISDHVIDTFTDTDFTLLSDHTPDLTYEGNEWVQRSPLDSEPYLVTNRLTPTATGRDWEFIEGGDGNSIVTATIHTAIVPNRVSIIFRAAVTSSTTSLWELRPTQTGTSLYRWEPGNTQVYLETMSGDSNDTTKYVRIVLVDASIKIYIDDVLVFDIVSSYNQTSTIYGFVSYGFLDNWMDDFVVARFAANWTETAPADTAGWTEIEPTHEPDWVDGSIGDS